MPTSCTSKAKRQSRPRAAPWKIVTSEQQLSFACQTCIWCTDILQPTASSLMQAIRPIIEIYVKLQNEAALLALKKQRLKVLATCYPNDPIFAKLRRQCREEISKA